MYFYVNRRLKVGDAFVGYQDDTTAAVVFQAYHNLKESQPGDKTAQDNPPKKEVTYDAYVLCCIFQNYSKVHNKGKLTSRTSIIQAFVCQLNHKSVQINEFVRIN